MCKRITYRKHIDDKMISVDEFTTIRNSKVRVILTSDLRFHIRHENSKAIYYTSPVYKSKATLLKGAKYYLVKNLKVKELLVREVRDRAYGLGTKEENLKKNLPQLRDDLT